VRGPPPIPVQVAGDDATRSAFHGDPAQDAKALVSAIEEDPGAAGEDDVQEPIAIEVPGAPGGPGLAGKDPLLNR